MSRNYIFNKNDLGKVTGSTFVALFASDLINPLDYQTSAAIFGIAACIDFVPYCAERFLVKAHGYLKDNDEKDEE